MSDDGLKPGEEHFPEPAHLDAAARDCPEAAKSVAGLALLGFVFLVGLTTFVRLSGSQDNQANFYYNMNQTGQEEAPELPPGCRRIRPHRRRICPQTRPFGGSVVEEEAPE
jgi:hypothetical protein